MKRLEATSGERSYQVQRLGILELLQVIARQAAILQRRDQALPTRRIQQAGRADRSRNRVWLAAVTARIWHQRQALAATFAQRPGAAEFATASEA